MKDDILIIVKTYPHISTKYIEVVCTAGVNRSGKWRRIYPVPFRQLKAKSKYKKFQWIKVKLARATEDRRPESYKLLSEDIEILGDPLSTHNMWAERRYDFLDGVRMYKSVNMAIKEAHNDEVSLVAFQPSRWCAFSSEEDDREWDKGKIAVLNRMKKQMPLFSRNIAEEFKLAKKLPYKFYYKFKDSEGKISKLVIRDWEIGMLYLNCQKRGKKEAIQKVRLKYWEQYIKSGRYSPILILGTTLEFHNKRAPNPFVIVSVLPFPKDNRQKLLL